jgi:hypothetical protein
MADQVNRDVLQTHAHISVLFICMSNHFTEMDSIQHNAFQQLKLVVKIAIRDQDFGLVVSPQIVKLVD